VEYYEKILLFMQIVHNMSKIMLVISSRGFSMTRMVNLQNQCMTLFVFQRLLLVFFNIYTKTICKWPHLLKMCF